ncbi:hypothetical protein MMC20_000644 [Loxospora ochrophaea]|nr:hypothetical protein [Loxospora ochrophaea]
MRLCLSTAILLLILSTDAANAIPSTSFLRLNALSMIQRDAPSIALLTIRGGTSGGDSAASDSSSASDSSDSDSSSSSSGGKSSSSKGGSSSSDDDSSAAQCLGVHELTLWIAAATGTAWSMML